MPTIPELPNASVSEAQDEIPVSQGGVTRAVTVAELLSGTQELLTIPSQSLLGRASLGPGSPESLLLGSGLALQGDALVPNGGDHLSFLQTPALTPGDEVIVNSVGLPRRLPATALRQLFSAGTNVSVDSLGVIAAATDPSVNSELNSLVQGLSAAQSGIAVVASKIPVGGFAGLNGSGQVTAPIAGDIGAATVTVPTGGSSRSMVRRALDSLNLLDFGATAGGSDCSGAFAAAYAQLPGAGGEIWIPSGDFWLASPLTLSGKAVSIRGSGKGQTRLHLEHTGVGFDFAPGNLFGKVLVLAVSIYAENMSGQTAAAIRITYPSTSAFGYVSAAISDVELFGYPNSSNGTAPFPQTFLRGVVLNNCWSSQINNLSWFGPPAPAGGTTSAVIELNGSVDTRLHALQAYYGNSVVLQTGYCEGIYLSNPLVVGTDYLFSQTDETKWAGYSPGRAMLLGLWAANGEVNTNLGTVQLTNVTDVFMSNLDITRNGGPSTSQIMFDLLNVPNCHVSGCNFVGGPTGGPSQDVAFRFRSTSNSSSNIIDGCHFEDLATVIQIIGANGTVGLTTYGLHLGNVPSSTAIMDPTPQEAGNHVSFLTPSQPGIPAGVGLSKDHVLAGTGGAVLFRVNNLAAAANFIRHQPATSSNPPTVCFDGQDGSVNGVIQTKGGNLFINAAGGASGSGNLVSFMNNAGASNWVVVQNALAGNLSLISTNLGGLGVQPKGALWLSPTGGLFLPNLPVSRPTSGTGQVWNNNGVLSIA